MIDICNRKKIPVLILDVNLKTVIAGKLKLTFLGAALENETVNNNSLVFKLSCHAFSMLFPGDIEKERENSLAAVYGDRLKSMVLLAPHHGSTTSSHNIFLDKVDPESVIIPCGWQNRYGFPHPRVLNRYRKKKINVFRTDKDGAVFTISDGYTYRITTFKEK
jgi:competence protein ComEC